MSEFKFSMYGFIEILEEELRRFEAIKARGESNDAVTLAVIHELKKIIKLAKLYNEGGQIQQVKESSGENN